MNGKQPEYLLSPSLVIIQAPETIAQYPYYLHWANSLKAYPEFASYTL